MSIVGTRLLLLLVMWVSCVGLTQGQAPDAIVESVAGKALVRGGQKAQPGRLKKGDHLSAGQWVSCGSGCKELTISYCNVPRPIRSGPGWKQIIAINCKSPEGQRGGGARGETGLIWSPKASQLVQPGTFTLRWKPLASPANIEIFHRISQAERVWGPQVADGGKDSLASASLRAALERAQEAGTLHLVLTANYGGARTQRIPFDLISVDDQKNLDRCLKDFSNEPDMIVKAIGRGSVFSEYGLNAEGAKEFERALTIALYHKARKRTLDELKKLTIMANYKAYNDARVRALCRSLKLSTLPDPCSDYK